MSKKIFALFFFMLLQTGCAENKLAPTEENQATSPTTEDVTPPTTPPAPDTTAPAPTPAPDTSVPAPAPVPAGN